MHLCLHANSYGLAAVTDKALAPAMAIPRNWPGPRPRPKQQMWPNPWRRGRLAVTLNNPALTSGKASSFKEATC